MAFLRNEGFFVFLYEKVVVTLQWIWMKNLRLRARKLNYPNL